MSFGVDKCCVAYIYTENALWSLIVVIQSYHLEIQFVHSKLKSRTGIYHTTPDNEAISN